MSKELVRPDLFKYREVVPKIEGVGWVSIRMVSEIAMEMHAETGSGVSSYSREAWINESLSALVLKIE